jgi:hypothetical protein
MQTAAPPAWLLVLPLAILVGGVLLRRWIGKRRFERTNPFGLESFESYDQMKMTQGAEGCLGCVGVLLVFFGLMSGLALLVARCAAG